ncbi:MAG: type II secretion system F family protein [Armatimonadota bacterium]|nr:MAG: type II secretion system F family protein [Armatimonadota bacterium]
MPIFRYDAMDTGGRTTTGTLEAESTDAVRNKLSELNYHVLSIAETRQRRGFVDWFNSIQRVKLRELVLFSRQFATMIDAGLSVVKCLDILQQQCKDPKLKDIIGQTKHDVASGASLTDAVGKHPRVFSGLYINMIRSAEAGGILDKVLDRLATFLEKEQEVRNKIKSAMMYPSVVFIFAMLMLLALLFFVLPKFKTIFESMNLELPLATRALLGFSGFATHYWFVFVLGGAAAVVAYKLYARTERGKYQVDLVKLKIPVMGDLFMKTAISRFARTFGTLISSGVPVLRALEIVSDTAGNIVVSQTITQARASVKEGEEISTPLMGSKIFPVMVVQMIGVGEETGRLDQMLAKVADFYDQEVDATLKGLTSLIEPLMIVGLGVIVGFIAVSVISPIYQLVGSIQ